MNWEELKRRVYHEDGSLRDIYIRNTTVADWQRWIAYVNAQHRVDFKVGNASKGARIDFGVVSAYWDGSNLECPSASIYLSDTVVKTYFSSEGEIENDITPKEVTSLNNHERLLQYLKDVSNLLGKPVELTEENPKDPAEVLLVVNGNDVRFPVKQGG